MEGPGGYEERLLDGRDGGGYNEILGDACGENPGVFV
jgi:hypothetical protein